MNWQPIETAPKDGTWVLLGLNLYDPRSITQVVVSRWYPDDGKWDMLGWVTTRCEYFPEPTHWSHILENGNNT